jgi:hypothetical protein
MHSSIFCNEAIFAHLLIIQLIITAFSYVRLLTIVFVSTASFRVRLLVIQLTITASYSDRVIMPVLIRSKTKILQSLSNQSSTVARYATTSSRSLSQIELNNQSKSYYDLSSSYPDHNSSSSSFEIIEFQNSHIIDDQFDNSKISAFENLKQLVADTTDHNQHFSIL